MYVRNIIIILTMEGEFTGELIWNWIHHQGDEYIQHFRKMGAIDLNQLSGREIRGE